MKKLCLLHTTDKFLEIIQKPFTLPFLDENPDIKVFDITDSSLIEDTAKAGYATPEVIRRMYSYIMSAYEAGADCVMVTCTSVNTATKIIKKFAPLPVFSIEEPVAKKAVEIGKRIGILASLGTSAKPVAETIKEMAKSAGKEVEIIIKVADGAFEALMKGDRGKHDEKICAALDELVKEVDVVVFSQISMALLKHKEYDIPVLKIGKASYEEAKKIMFNNL